MRNTSGLWRDGLPGRPAGTPNCATREARTFCQCLVADPEYRANLERRWREGKLPPVLEQMIWAYAVGKPSGLRSHRSWTITRVDHRGNGHPQRR